MGIEAILAIVIPILVKEGPVAWAAAKALFDRHRGELSPEAAAALDTQLRGLDLSIEEA
jgi:hypothetical protein